MLVVRLDSGGLVPPEGAADRLPDPYLGLVFEAQAEELFVALKCLIEFGLWDAVADEVEEPIRVASFTYSNDDLFTLCFGRCG